MWCGLWSHFLIHVTVLGLDGAKESYHWMPNVEKQTKKNTTCLHRAPVESSECLEVAAVRFDLKRGQQHVCSQNIHCSLLVGSLLMWTCMRTRHSCLCLRAPGSCWVVATSEKETTSRLYEVISNTTIHKKEENVTRFQYSGGVLAVFRSRWSCARSHDRRSRLRGCSK